MVDPQKLAQSAGEVRRRVSDVAPYAMLRQAGVHGAIYRTHKADASGWVMTNEFDVVCEVCAEWSETGLPDHDSAIGALEDHLVEEHGDFVTEWVVALRAGGPSGDHAMATGQAFPR